ncbi:MAG: carboxypeptidase M32, partial [Psychrobacillus psychrotolerans]
MSVEQNFLDYVKKIGAYQEALGVLYWDMRTGAPKKGIDQRSEVVGVLATDVFNLSTSDDLKELLDQMELELDSVNEVSKRVFEEVKKEYNLSKKIPADEYKKFVILQSKSESVWEEAKNNNDWSMFQPYLTEMVATLKSFVEYWGVTDNNPYNVLLDQYEPGMTTEILDQVFNELREKIVSLLKRISESPNQPKTDFLFQSFDKQKQESFSLDILKQLGYDFDAGRLDETVHPFATGLNRGDVRITTKYDEFDFRSAIFGTIHE